MRVVSGDFRGLNLKAVPGDSTRPTSAKVKESIFNIINPYLKPGNCLDLFAGTGSLGIEAVSRGFEKSYLIDKNFKAINTIKENIKKTHAESKFAIINSTASDALTNFIDNNIKFDLVFLDPPYRMHITKEITNNLISDGLLNDGCVIVIETDYETEKIESPNIKIIQEKRYGETNILIYQYEE